MGSDTTSEQPGWRGDASEGSPPHRHRVRRRVPWFRVILALAVCVVLTWASTSPGGLRERFSDIGSSIKGAVSNVTESRDLDAATKTFNGWYEQRGQYPNYSPSQLDERTDASWGVGMNVFWCTPRSVVLTSFTASGTVSRLLIDGKGVGDVPGRVGCPADLVNPLPWKR